MKKFIKKRLSQMKISLLMPKRRYYKQFYFEPEVLKTILTEYSPVGDYPVMYKNDKYHITSRILGSSPSFDAEEIPTAEYNNSKYYNSVRVAQYGLLMYNFGKVDVAVKCCEWLLNYCREGKLFYDIDYTMSQPNIKISRPFVSSMAQGQALSLICRVKDKIGINENSLKNICSEIISVITAPISEGGTASTFAGHVWYEEYPDQPGAHVLNGFIFCLIGLYDYWKTFNDEAAKQAFEKGYESLIACLPCFDTGAISLYHLGHIEYPGNDVCISVPYHIVHIKLLEVMNIIKPHKILEFYLTRWRKW